MCYKSHFAVFSNIASHDFLSMETLLKKNYICFMKKLITPTLLILSLFFLIRCQSTSNLNYKKTAAINSVILTSHERSDHQSAEAIGHKIAISTQGIYATKAAREISLAGGNAIDAAIAASFVLAVERPHSTGLSGGGFMLYREGHTGKIYAIDFRERAPIKSTEHMYLDRDGFVDSHLSQDGIKASAVPGLVAGLVEIHQRFGKLSLKKVVQPAIELAENGFPIYPSLARALVARADILKKDSEASRLFLDSEKNPLKEGHVLIQKDLANTLKLIASHGRAGFYKGMTAKYLTTFLCK